MNTNILNQFMYATIVLTMTCFFCSCTKKQNDECNGTIEGKWKLVKITVPFTPTGPKSYDYSKHDIVYEFDTNGILTVSVETGQIDWYGGHEKGEYSYSIIDESEAKEAVGANAFVLKIGTLYYSYNVNDKELIIDSSPLDGFVYYFIKIVQ